MSKITTFYCEYLAAATNYTSRLIDDDGIIDTLTVFCSKHGVVPLFIAVGYGMIPVITHLEFNNGRITLDNVTNEQRILNEQLLARIIREPCHHNDLIVFRTGTFAKATKVMFDLDSLEFCVLSNITDINFLANDQGNIDMVHVKWDSESG